MFPSCSSDQQLLDHVAGLPLSQQPRLALIRLVTLPQLELGHRDRPVLAIALGGSVVGEASPAA